MHNNLLKEPKLAILHSSSKKCINMLNFISSKVKLYSLEEADIILCLGGDGFMLHTLHTSIAFNKPIYGINCGSLGFLMNDFTVEDNIEGLLETLQCNTTSIKTHPLEVTFTTNNGAEINSLAFNEASLLRNDGIAAHLKIYVNEQLQTSKLVCDGALVSTPIGSLAYNKACGGPIIPIESKLLILTAINPFEPASFKGAVLPEESVITIEVITSNTRKVNLFCDFIKHTEISNIKIKKSKNKFVKILFNKKNHFIQKISNVQFAR